MSDTTTLDSAVPPSTYALLLEQERAQHERARVLLATTRREQVDQAETINTLRAEAGHATANVQSLIRRLQADNGWSYDYTNTLLRDLGLPELTPPQAVTVSMDITLGQVVVLPGESAIEARDRAARELRTLVYANLDGDLATALGQNGSGIGVSVWTATVTDAGTRDA